ncbi:hypothetical protein ACFPM3_22960 [Streptomyces coeruleoprunus]|uniref:Uncharacterized protein n=1 Tax=Streptomyces coeruleoprunus TaxID=285563 RepID=A0ABV9XKJ6_9ACTN
MSLKVTRRATVWGDDEDNGGHGTSNKDIESGDGKGGSGSPGH